MKEDEKKAAWRVLNNYLSLNNHRRTPERYAILDAVFDTEGMFTLDELGEKLLVEDRFRVSRATLYNTLKLFMTLRIVIQHRFQGRTLYEKASTSHEYCHQMCTVCGRVKDIEAPTVAEAVKKLKLGRFSKDGFALYVYGICTSCQMKIRRMEQMQDKEWRERMALTAERKRIAKEEAKEKYGKRKS